MSPNILEGLPGVAPYVWPADELAPIIAEVAAVHAAWHRADSHDRRLMMRYQAAAERLSTRARFLFAAANGWRPSRTFSPRHLWNGKQARSAYSTCGPEFPGGGSTFDHAEFFKRGRYAAAVVVHNYDFPPEDLDSRLTVYRLPESWYSPGPGGTTGYLIAGVPRGQAVAS
jgi:hypothetical protein